MSFRGNNHTSVAILDNCSIHHLQDILDLIHSAGALAIVVFLPTYSSDLMPIEKCFNKV